MNSRCFIYSRTVKYIWCSIVHEHASVYPVLFASIDLNSSIDSSIAIQKIDSRFSWSIYYSLNYLFINC